MAIAVGIVLGYARYKDFDAIVPWYWLSVGVGAAFVLGALAGLYPAGAFEDPGGNPVLAMECDRSAE